jgi:hypothetical protein
LDCVIGRRRITIQPPLSGLAKTSILKPIATALFIAEIESNSDKIRAAPQMLLNASSDSEQS